MSQIPSTAQGHNWCAFANRLSRLIGVKPNHLIPSSLFSDSSNISHIFTIYLINISFSHNLHQPSLIPLIFSSHYIFCPILSQISQIVHPFIFCLPYILLYHFLFLSSLLSYLYYSILSLLEIIYNNFSYLFIYLAYFGHSYPSHLIYVVIWKLSEFI